MILALALLSVPMLAQPRWESGQPIPVGTPDRRGLLNVGLTSFPVGYGRVTGARQPDLFAVAGRLSDPAGLFLYPWKGITGDGIPVFGERWQIGIPVRGDGTLLCAVVESRGEIHGFFVQGSKIVAARFDPDRRAFLETERISLDGLPFAPRAVAAAARPDGKWEFVLSVPTERGYAPPGAGWRSKDYVPYDGTGIWRGSTARFALWALVSGEPPRRLSRTGEEILWNPGTLTLGAFGANREQDVVSGSWFGDLYYFRNTARRGVALGARRNAVGEDGILLRHPLAGAYPLAYPKASGSGHDLIAGGEGGLYYYRFTGRFDAQDRPVFRKPTPVLQENANLMAGTLSVPTIVDWDGDGVLDIVAGNSEGRILFFRNLGSNQRPAMANGAALLAGGREIHMQPGYKGDIQGPGEARWGYLSPNVFDWNGDGLPDILASDSTARHYVFLNRGTRTAPRLEADRTLYLDGLDLHGTWRVRPGVGRMGGRVAYIALDDQDQFHRYWRVDDYNLADDGKLRMEDGSPITANFLSAGATGRSKIEIVDWDGDGVADLLVGTPKHHSIPNPEQGLPRALGLPGTMVLFLKNTGSEREPRYRFPVGLRHKGRNIYLGHHEIGVAAGKLGPGGELNLVVSREDGRMYFFERAWIEPR
jgi:hypothetical protein